MSKKPKKSTAQTSTTKTMTMPDWLMPSLQNVQSRAEEGLNNPAYMGQGATTQAGMNAMQGAYTQPVARTDYSQAQPGVDMLENTARGDYLYGGEGFNAAQQAAANRIIPQVTSAFNSSGRMGGIAGQSELTGRLGDSFAGLYNNERQRQMSAAPMVQNMLTGQTGDERLAMQNEINNARGLTGLGQMQDADALAQANDYNARTQRYIQELDGVAPYFRG